MLDKERFAKVLALAGSDVDGEALAALRTAQKMLRAANLSFTDVAQSFGSGGKSGSNSAVIDRLHATILSLHCRLADAEREIDRLRSRKGLSRTRAEIAASIRVILKSPDLSRLPDREIARRTGLSPQTVGNWRRRLEAERTSKRHTAHNGRKRAA
jgi:hypothetical protein